jgi:putative oxidoreductase
MTDSISMPARAWTLNPAKLHDRFVAFTSLLPMSVVQLAARLAIAKVFWSSAQSKLASWPVTEQLFAMEYKLPILPPDVAAALATATELGGAVLIALGLFTRVAALALLGVVATIQIFVYPQFWGEHLLWASLLMLLASRGAGAFSLDRLAGKLIARG